MHARAQGNQIKRRRLGPDLHRGALGLALLHNIRAQQRHLVVVLRACGRALLQLRNQTPDVVARGARPGQARSAQ